MSGFLSPLLPSKRPDVLVADFDTELVVLVPGQRRAHHLDEGLSLVLDACDGHTSSRSVVDEVMTGTGAAQETVETWLLDALRQLAALDLFEPPEASAR